ncbi:MAG: non-ribosomal peptide synthetase, partial [bacterium]|nr:non-ribosomal peptide synthetase [bacterium]
ISPELESMHALDINGMTARGRLSLAITYSGNEYQKKDIEKLALYYRQALQEIILHCMEKKERTLTPSDLTFTGISIPELEELQHRFAMEKKQIANIYPLSPMQENMLFHARRSMETTSSMESNDAYFEQMSLEIQGRLDVTLLEKTYNKLVEKYDVLRTVFLYEMAGRPAQVLLKHFHSIVHYEDVAHLGTAEAKKVVEQFKRDDREAGFHPESGPLMRIALFRTAEKTNRIIWSFHHILMDGWCFGILFKDFLEIYRALLQEKPVPKETVVPYGRYIQWLEKQNRRKGLDYWANYAQDYEQQAVVPKQTKAGAG